MSERHRVVPRLGGQEQARVDGAERDSGDPARAAPAGAAGRRTFRHVGPERPLPPRHHPQQPPQTPDRDQGPGGDSAQREAHVAGGRRLAVRQLAQEQRREERVEPSAQVAVGFAQGQAGPLPPEPAGQACRLLGPFGHRRRSRAEDARDGHSEGHGRRTLQAVRDPQAHRARHRQDGEVGQEDHRPQGPRDLGHSGECHQGTPRADEPRPDAAPPRYPGVPAQTDRGQGHAAAPAGMYGVQRRLRRRPDGRAPAAGQPTTTPKTKYCGYLPLP